MFRGLFYLGEETKLNKTHVQAVRGITARTETTESSCHRKVASYWLINMRRLPAMSPTWIDNKDTRHTC